MQKFKVSGQLIPKIEWKQNRQTEMIAVAPVLLRSVINDHELYIGQTMSLVYTVFLVV